MNTMERDIVKKLQAKVNLPKTEGLTTASEAGLTYKDIYEARIIRDAEVADPEIVRRLLDALETIAGERDLLGDTISVLSRNA